MENEEVLDSEELDHYEEMAVEIGFDLEEAEFSYEKYGSGR